MTKWQFPEVMCSGGMRSWVPHQVLISTTHFSLLALFQSSYHAHSFCQTDCHARKCLFSPTFLQCTARWAAEAQLEVFRGHARGVSAVEGDVFSNRFTEVKSRRPAIGRFKNGARSSHGCGDRSTRRWLVGVCVARDQYGTQPLWKLPFVEEPFCEAAGVALLC